MACFATEQTNADVAARGYCWACRPMVITSTFSKFLSRVSCFLQVSFITLCLLWVPRMSCFVCPRDGNWSITFYFDKVTNASTMFSLLTTLLIILITQKASLRIGYFDVPYTTPEPHICWVSRTCPNFSLLEKVRIPLTWSPRLRCELSFSGTWDPSWICQSWSLGSQALPS